MKEIFSAVRKVVCGWVIAVAMLAGMSAGAGAQRGTHPLRIHNGTLTVDGLPAETGVDVRIANLRYLYIGLPGAGTAIVSERPFAGAHEQRGAFHGNALTVTANGSRLQLTAGNKLRGNRSVFVRFDRGADGGLRTPALGFGDAAVVPATWPVQGIESRSTRRRVKVSARRPGRTAKLCRPSSHGGEQCATVREVVYKP